MTSPSVTAPSMARLTLVELRKAVDTRAGRWLLGAVAALTVATVVVQVAAGAPDDRTLGGLIANAQLPASVLLPVVGLLSVTGEWSQRTALTTFALVPARMRVVGAKVLAVSLVALVATAVAVVVGLGGFAVAQATDRAVGGWGVSGAVLAQLGVVNWVTMLCGTAFGLLVLGTAAAVVTYYVVPIGWSVLGRIVPGLDGAAEWLDIGRARVPLVEADVTGTEWARLLVSVLLWVALPALIGTLRIRRADIT